MATAADKSAQPSTAKRPIREILKDDGAIQAALTRGFYRAVLRHRAGNVPMVMMRDGKMIDVDAHDIPIPDGILTYITTTPEPQFRKYTPAK